MKTSKDLEFHPLANMFPMMVDAEGLDIGHTVRALLAGRELANAKGVDEWKAFVADIRQNGQLEPVILYEGKIVDGRNRYVALRSLGLPVQTREYDGDDLFTDVLSWNLHRRHLTASQRAAVVVDAEELVARLAAEAEARRVENLTPGNPRKDATPSMASRDAIETEKPAPAPAPVEAGRTAEKLAAIAGTSRKTVERVQQVKREAPEQVERIKRGQTTAASALRDLEAKKRAAQAAHVRTELDMHDKVNDVVRGVEAVTGRMDALVKFAERNPTFLSASMRRRVDAALEAFSKSEEEYHGLRQL